ncbi:hypothetical protein LCGC14_0964450 [marine sediment metagenome]|uniref:Uncharacterized protein n=1 Tax=marine sediment metagenome TaxID=412755 RepID=A0A0F9NI02_9ZZZZ
MTKSYKGEREIDRNANYVHTMRVARLTWDGEPVTRVTLRRYIKSTGRLVDEMTVPAEALNA